jgi:hypothetical protein
MKLSPFVIPGRAAGASPESITTGHCCFKEGR